MPSVSWWLWDAYGTKTGLHRTNKLTDVHYHSLGADDITSGMAKLLVRYGTEHHVRVSIITPDWGSVNLSVSASPAETPLLSLRKERRICKYCGVIVTLIRLLKPPLFLLWWSEATLAIWNDRLAKDLFQPIIPPTVKLEPATQRLQIQAFWSIELSCPLF